MDGITAVQFDADAQTSFKAVVASAAGPLCNGLCAASDVTITSLGRRRTLAVDFELRVSTAADATVAANALTAFISSPAFVEVLVSQGGELAGVHFTLIASLQLLLPSSALREDWLPLQNADATSVCY